MIDQASTLEQPVSVAAKPVRPLDPIERRVLGTLIEKGKTTPDQYPMSLNGLVSGCNQKSNRDPAMTLDEERVSRALGRLRECGAAAEVFGSGRIARYRHLAYEWLGVEKEELAILGELLLRGEQSEGDLRGRASRMDPIPDLGALRTHLDRLAGRGLVVWLSPPGRGRLLTHGLLPPDELREVQVRIGGGVVPSASPSGSGLQPGNGHPSGSGPRPANGPSAVASPDRHEQEIWHGLDHRIAQLEATVAELLERIATIEMEGGPGREG
jgi:uncharacterized protein YceH (UPF0502 family)